MTVPKHNPLKQGLKHVLSLLKSSSIFVPKHNPLKQGLKQLKYIDCRPVRESSKA